MKFLSVRKGATGSHSRPLNIGGNEFAPASAVKEDLTCSGSSLPKKKGGPSPMSSSSQAKKNKTILSGCKLIGWARPKNFLDIYHHPQPPSKYIGYSEICQEVYLHLGEINLLRQLRSYGILWDIFNLTKRKYANRQKKGPR